MFVKIKFYNKLLENFNADLIQLSGNNTRHEVSTPIVIPMDGQSSIMGNNDNNYLILGLASPSNMETSENQMNGHSGPSQIPEGEKSNNFENESVNPINILENEEENSQPSQKEDVQPSSSNC